MKGIVRSTYNTIKKKKKIRRFGYCLSVRYIQIIMRRITTRTHNSKTHRCDRP